MIQGLLKFVVIGVSAGIIGFIGLAIYGEVTQTEAANMSESVQLAQNQGRKHEPSFG